MQILSRVTLTFGVIILIAAALLLGKDVIDINQLHAVANANRSTNFPSPLNTVLITAVLAVIGGFLTGLGLGMPKRLPRTPNPTEPRAAPVLHRPVGRFRHPFCPQRAILNAPHEPASPDRRAARHDCPRCPHRAGRVARPVLPPDPDRPGRP